MVQKHSLEQERRATIILITDGETSDEAGVIDAFKPYPQIRVHTFGIDTTVNDALLRSIARQQRGQVALHTPADDIAGSIQRLAHRMRQPVLLELVPANGWEASSPLPDLYAGEIITVSLRAGSKAGPLAISAKLPNSQNYLATIGCAVSQNSAIALLWKKDRITQLLESGDKKTATELSIASNLVCVTTAFIAVDSAAKVAQAEQVVVQPSVEPLYLGGQKHLQRAKLHMDAARGNVLYCFSPGVETFKKADQKISSLSDKTLKSFAGKRYSAGTLSQLTSETGKFSTGKSTPLLTQPVLDDAYILQLLKAIPLLSQPSGRRFVRLLINWMNDSHTNRAPIVHAWVMTLVDKSNADVIAACIEFTKTHMTNEPLALQVAQEIK